MAKWNTTWRVRPHGPIEKLSDRLWRIEAKLDSIDLRRVMTAARRADGSLVVHNAIPLGEAEMAELDAWGKVTTLVVPNRFHRLDARPFAERYPEARVLCPRGATRYVRKAVKVDGAYEDLPPDGTVDLVSLDGTKAREGVMIVRGDVTSVILNDAVFNMDHAGGFFGLLLRLIGASGKPCVEVGMRWLMISDKRAFRSHLESLADLPRLTHVVVSHHKVITDDPAGTLRKVVATF
jgi:hypothetical protein